MIKLGAVLFVLYLPSSLPSICSFSRILHFADPGGRIASFSSGGYRHLGCSRGGPWERLEARTWHGQMASDRFTLGRSMARRHTAYVGIVAPVANIFVAIVTSLMTNPLHQGRGNTSMNMIKLRMSSVGIFAAAGVKRIYGIVGDSFNGLTDAVRRLGKIEWVHVRHEEVAAFAAGAEAHLTENFAVCAGSCGPGNLHLINGLFDAIARACRCSQSPRK